jgi:hypothetical protein
MLEEQAQMRARRARLGNLQSLLTNEWRTTCGDAVAPPPTITAAVAASDPPPAWKPSSPYVERPAEPPTPWRERLQALLEDAEVEIEAHSRLR